MKNTRRDFHRISRDPTRLVSTSFSFCTVPNAFPSRAGRISNNENVENNEETPLLGQALNAYTPLWQNDNALIRIPARLGHRIWPSADRDRIRDILLGLLAAITVLHSLLLAVSLSAIVPSLSRKWVPVCLALIQLVLVGVWAVLGVRFYRRRRRLVRH
jgi:hypothetical protein